LVQVEALITPKVQVAIATPWQLQLGYARKKCRRR
jgi:hypothetical protein